MNEKPKNQGNLKGGAVLVVFALIAAAFLFTLPLIINATRGSAFGSDNFPYVSFYFSSLILLVPLAIGIIMLVKGIKHRDIMKSGRKTTCTIHKILRDKRGFEMIVIFRGDSGKEYFHIVYIDYQEAATFKDGEVIECYVKGEDCYVNQGHIVVVKQQQDDRFR